MLQIPSAFSQALRCLKGLADMEDCFPRKATVQKLTCHVSDSRPRGFNADPRREFASGNQSGKTCQPDCGRLGLQFIEENETVQCGAARREELADIKS